MIPFETNIRLSHSQIWETQREFFTAKGVNAWNGQVPFYITSNPRIAHTYAELIIRYWQDQIALNNNTTTEPFYIVELGTGTGQFSFYCLQKLCELRDVYGLKNLKFCYVMTDFTNANVSFWEKHPQLLPYLDQGILDFAIFDGERSTEITLLNQAITLKNHDIINPLVVIGNYLFDTLLQDVFCIKNNILHEALVNTSTLQNNLVNGKLTALQDIDTRFEYRAIDASGYYPNPLLNQILSVYPAAFKNGHFLFPTGGFTALHTLQNLSNDQMLLLSTDKGYSELSELEERGSPSVVCHGSLSMNVNFHAIGEYFIQQGGDVFHQTIRDAIRSCAFTLGATFKDLPRTHQTMIDLFEGFSPGDYFNLHRHFRETTTIQLKTLLSHLALSHWDPYLFSVFIEKLTAEVPKLSATLKQGVIENICEHVLSQIYLLPGSQDHYFNAGLLLHKLERYGLAIECYQYSMDYQMEHFNAQYNQALCWHALHNKEAAMRHFERAKLLEKDGTKAQQWIDHLNAQSV